MKRLPYYRPTTAARRCEITVGCIKKAMSRGHIPVYETLDGMRLVKLADVRKYANTPRKLGRKRLTPREQAQRLEQNR